MYMRVIWIYYFFVLVFYSNEVIGVGYFGFKIWDFLMLIYIRILKEYFK